jgi:hypothetical protein
MNAYDNNSGYLGVNGWRLPDYVDLPPTVGCNTSGASYSGSDCGYNVDTASGELAHMFFITLGNLAEYDTNGNQRAMGNYGAKNTGNFYNLLFEPYWYGDVSTQDATKSWYFNTHYGLQRRALNTYELVAWAVHDGDIGTALATVPVPAALWLFGAGLLGLVGIARKGSS